MRPDEARTLNPGLLRHQITWQRKMVTGQDNFGQDIYAWVNAQTCRVQIKALGGRELEAARQRWAEARYRVMQHYVPGMDPAWRGSWYVDGAVRYLGILDIQDPAGTGRVQVITANEWTE